MQVTGDCNDYVGKGMNGGRISAVAPESSSFASQAAMGKDVPHAGELTAIAPWKL